MQEKTRLILLQAYIQLQEIAAQLYSAAEQAAENRNYDDASLLEARANKIFEEAENLDILISELQEDQ